MSTSKLQKYVNDNLSLWLGGLDIKENHRPDWLITNLGERLELDFFLEQINVAIEVQGMQHYQFVEFFHIDDDGYKSQKRRDKFKKNICEKMGIELYEVFDRASADSCIRDLFGKHRNIPFLNNSLQIPAPYFSTYYELPKKKIKKLICTIITYRKSSPERSQQALEDLIDLVSDFDKKVIEKHIKTFMKKRYPTMI